MKKTLFTISSIIVVCSAIILSCSKDTLDGKGVTYANQPGVGTGTNPNPNGNPSTTGLTTGSSSSSSSTSSTTGGSTMIVNGASGTSVSASGGVSGGNYVLVHSSSLAQIQITFGTAAAPPSGTYAIVASGPNASQCMFKMIGGGSGNATLGNVSVTAGTPNTASYSNIVVNATPTNFTLTGTAKY